MADAQTRFTEAAAARGITVEATVYPEETRTAADAAAAIGCDVAAIVKSLIFMADETPILVLTSGANQVDLGIVGAHVGATLRRATADEARAASGYAIGGTPPFGHPATLRTVVDVDLLALDTVWAAAGSPRACFPLSSAVLAATTEAEPLSLAAR